MKYLNILIFGCCSLVFYHINVNIQNEIKENEMKLIKNSQLEEVVNIFSNLRKKINYINKMNIDINNDTLFIVDIYDIEDETSKKQYYCILWNEKQILNYKITGKRNNHYKSLKYQNMLSDYQFNLISNWDIKQIDEDSKIYKLNGGGVLFVSRIIFKNNKYKIDTLLFNNFYNFKKEYVYP